MTTEFATKISKNIFSYHLSGFNRNILYSKVNQSIILTEAKTGEMLTVIDKGEDLEFDDFVLVARNLWLDLVESNS